MNEALNALDRIQEILTRFDPDQPRDAQGRWTSGGAGSDTASVVSDAKKAHESVPGFSYSEPAILAAATAGFGEGDTIDFGSGRKAEIGKGGSITWKVGDAVKATNTWATITPQQQHQLRTRHAYVAGMKGYGTGIR